MVNIRFVFVFAIALLALLVLSGCLMEKKISDCQAMEQSATAGAAIRKELTGAAATCYHEVAIYQAMTNTTVAAIDACRQIGDAGIFTPSTQSEMNNCYADVAEATHDNASCALIDVGTIENIGQFAGVWTSYRDQCYEKSKPANYSPELCRSAAPFVLVPLLALLASAYRRKKKD
ncbi:Uncharacterised protein [uncultured archaeon]|nr:Uncharacterised protein [uncultured archaeon]